MVHHCYGDYDGMVTITTEN